MDYKAAAAFRMPFGKHKGRSLDEIAVSDSGLLYLDWLRGERGNDGSDIANALSAYLNDPSISKEVETAIQASKRSW